MSLSLKHIPCPAGNSCTAFHCIFGHEKDKGDGHGDNSARARTSPADTAQPQSNKEPSPEGSETPRKRQKLGHAPFPGQTGSNDLTSDGPQYGESVVTQGSSPGPLQTATRPVSPPPLKRPPLKATDAQTTSKSPPSNTRKVGQPKKTEYLNPRLLKSSPASHDVRLKLLRMVFQELTRLNAELKKDGNDDEQKLVLSEQDLIRRALDEEQGIAAEKGAVYSNVMKNRVMHYKRMTPAQWKTERSNEASAAQKGKMGRDGSGEPVKIETGLTDKQEVQLLGRLLTPIEKLANHGYVNAVPSAESVEKARQGLEAAKGWEKCDRCQQRFQVFPGRREEDGALTTGGPCNFHWGKTYVPEKPPGETGRVPKRYRCCGEEVGESAGCFARDHHVFKAPDAKRLAAVLDFAETPPNSLAPADRAICFDCEMCYTVYGLELVRLTATSWPRGEELMDVLVRPLGEVLDLNSRFSGVWPEDMAQAEPWTVEDTDPKPSKSGTESVSEEGELPAEKSHKRKKLKMVSSPEVARDLLFSLVSPSTPLIGHGLENDLNAVRAVHGAVVDTVLLYPHRAGLPFRNGLRALMDAHLGRKIQQDTDGALGHDSAEDARAAGDLVRLRVAREWKDMQRAGWRLVDGEFVAPGVKAGKEGALTEDFIES